MSLLLFRFPSGRFRGRFYVGCCEVLERLTSSQNHESSTPLIPFKITTSGLVQGEPGVKLGFWFFAPSGLSFPTSDLR